MAKLKAVLLGPRGQLGTDISTANERRESVNLVPVTREQLDLSDLEAAEAFLAGQDFDVRINCSS